MWRQNDAAALGAKGKAGNQVERPGNTRWNNVQAGMPRSTARIPPPAVPGTRSRAGRKARLTLGSDEFAQSRSVLSTQ
jgi:hypothetical protein